MAFIIKLKTMLYTFSICNCFAKVTAIGNPFHSGLRGVFNPVDYPNP